MRATLLTMTILAASFSTVTQANTPTMYSAVGLGPTSISAVIPRSEALSLEAPTRTERRNLALIGMILMQTRNMPNVR